MLTLEVLFASCVISVAFRFWPVLNFFVSFLMMPLALFDAYKHPLVFFVNASAKQFFSSQNFYTSNRLIKFNIAPQLITISI
jgi:hypothetical protein